MSEQELKPCPFCGGTATANDWHGATYVGCANCHIETVTVPDKSVAIGVWNRRANEEQDEPAGEDVRGRIVAAYGKGRWLREYDALVAERDQLRAEVEALRGLVPDFPPRPPDGEGLPRYGLRWNGPQQPLSVPMADGYWTPWHLANGEVEALRKDAERYRWLRIQPDDH